MARAIIGEECFNRLTVVADPRRHERCGVSPDFFLTGAWLPSTCEHHPMFEAIGTHTTHAAPLA